MNTENGTFAADSSSSSNSATRPTKLKVLNRATRSRRKSATVETTAATPAIETEPAIIAEAPTAPAPEHQTDQPSARRETKQSLLITLLSRPDGASIAELASATGWQNHSVRGAISFALKKKLGLTITSAQADRRGRVYRIGTPAKPARASRKQRA